MKSKKLVQMVVLCVVWLTSITVANAQDRVSGTVTDEEGRPLVGVTVMVPNTIIGTQSDTNGKWILQISNPETAVIQFSCLGYKPIEEAVLNRAVVNVVMEEDKEALEEVVVVGYGTQKKVNLTGAVSVVNFDETAKNRTITSASAALAGLAAGVAVTQTSAQPGVESTSIRIRGTSSFTSGACSPLILVDGMEWSIDRINPNDIESISILKDAASTAIYGSRGANGVILVTTKTGKADKPHVSYSYKGIMQVPENKVAFVSDYVEYMECANEAAINYGQQANFSQTTIDSWKAAQANPNGLNEFGVPNYMAYPNTEWFSEIFNSNYSQEHNLSISGGAKATHYMVSASFLDNQGVMTRDNLDSSTKRGTFRINLESDPFKWLTIGAKVEGQYQTYGTANLSRVFNYLYQASPAMYPGSANAWGYVAVGEDAGNQYNPFYQAMNSGSGDDKLWRFNGTVYGILRPYKGLSIEASFNYSPTMETAHIYSVENGLWDYYSNTRFTSSQIEDATVKDQTYRTYRMTTDLLLRYETTFNTNHAFGVMAGYSEYQYFSWNWSVTKKGGTEWILTDGSTYSELYDSSHSAKTGYSLRSYFARVNYAYKDRYLFEANFRADGSSRFGPNNRYGYFPSVSAGWKIHEEPFMKDASRWLSELKLRASWGQTGNDMGIGNFDYQATYTTGKAVLDGSTTTGLYIGSVSNANLKWETTSSTDIGIDASFFDNRLSVGADYYYKNTRDILSTPTSYQTMGDLSAVPENMGTMWNQGIELTLNWRDTVGDGFYYYVGVNFSYNKNMVTSYKGPLTMTYDENGILTGWNFDDVVSGWTAPGYLTEGHEIGEHFIYRLYRGTGKGYTNGEVDINAGPKDGMIRTEADMAWVNAMIKSGYTFQSSSVVSKGGLWYGDFIYADLNGDGNYGNTYDRSFSGKGVVPHYNLGITLGFSWKGLDFSMIWSGAFDFNIYWDTLYYNVSIYRDSYGIPAQVAYDHYFYNPDDPTNSRTNINGKYPRFFPSSVESSKNHDVYSDFYDYKGDYFKLKNVTIGYTIPQKWTRKAFIDELRFFVTGENILSIDSYPGIDPELGNSISYPLMRQYTVGAQITF